MISVQDEGAILCMKQTAGPQRYLRIKLTQTCIIIISGGIKFCVHPILYHQYYILLAIMGKMNTQCHVHSFYMY